MTPIVVSARGNAGALRAADRAGSSRAVLLVSHGSRDPRAAGVVARLAGAVRSGLGGTRVAVAHLDFTEPGVGAALVELAAAGAREVVVVPLLFAPGYHVRVDLPSAVAEVRAGLPWLQAAIAEPLIAGAGADDLMLDALDARLAEVHPTRGYDGLVLASAGSSESASRAAVEDLAARWSQRCGVPVVAGFATGSGPGVDEAVERLRSAGHPRIGVGLLFLAPGRLPDAARRAALAAGAAGVGDPLGVTPALVRLVIERVNGLVRALG